MATTTPVRPTRSTSIPTQRQASRHTAEPAREALRPSVRVGVPAVRPAVSPRPGLRLTRRGRLVVFAAAVVLLLLGAALQRPGGPAFAGDTDRGPATRTVVVQQGQTMWQIARDIRPGADPRDTVRRIQELNGLTTAQVWAGQPLVVPN